MPYALHEKSGLASVVIDPNRVSEFEKDQAQPELVKVSPYTFLDSSQANSEEGRRLLLHALDFVSPQLQERKEYQEISKKFEVPSTAIPEKFFPPCMKNILTGLKDGKKRALFTLINFLKTLGWNPDEIEQFLREWNKRNAEPLRENYLVGQLKYNKNKQPIPPPNCKSFYQDLRVCTPDRFCPKIKKTRLSMLNAKHGLQTDKQKRKKNRIKTCCFRMKVPSLSRSARLHRKRPKHHPFL